MNVATYSILKKFLMFSYPIMVFANSNPSIEVGFSPKNGSQDLILRAINSSKATICMTAYSFTSKPVSEALLKAKQRGINIKIVADEKANNRKYTATRFLANHGLNVRLNNNYPIMHNKFIVIDNHTVETGSFNYSANANINAENVIVIWNNPEIASTYSKECERLYNEAQPINRNF